MEHPPSDSSPLVPAPRSGERATPGGDLASVLDRATLLRLAGARAFERGEEYAKSGRVRGLVERRGGLRATVDGSRPYRVGVRCNRGALEGSCDCPRGNEGELCKHCVAVALAWLAPDRPIEDEAPPSPDAVRAHLLGLEKSALVDLLVEVAEEDEGLRRRLLVDAAAGRRGAPDLAALRGAIDAAIRVDGSVPYGEMRGYILGVDRAVGAVEALVRTAPAAAVELAEHALAAIEASIESIDDSDGAAGDALRRLERIHLEACRSARPDPEALAKRLFEWEIEGEWDVFADAADPYARVLGEKGLAAYRRLAEAAWRRVPPLAPGDEDPDRYGKRFRIARIVESLARRSGDLDALVEAKARDLSSPHSFLDIAETCARAGKADLALEWGERGLAAFPGGIHAGLREFVGAEYARRGRHDDAVALAWADDADRASLAAFQRLKERAAPSGRWPEWRAKALARLREGIGGPAKAWERRWEGAAGADASELVRVLLWEREDEAAWDEARAAGCSAPLWLELAGRRERARPEESIPVYRRCVDLVLAARNDDAYREAIGILGRLRSLLARLGREAEFAGIVAEVRARHRAKRNFTKRLDREAWGSERARESSR